MNDFNFIDIILFAMIAAFLVLRLRSVLGRRDGHEGGYKDIFHRKTTNDNHNHGEKADDNIVQLADREEEEKPAPEEEEEANILSGMDKTLATGITQVKRADPSFDHREFASGARIAFEMILGAYAAGDEKSLTPLLSPEVFANFSQAIRDREEAGEVMEDALIGINSADAVEIFMEGTVANVTLKIVSEQIKVIRNAEGEIIEGDENKVIEVTDFWTFARDTKSENPNWTLVATRSLD
jgi:predicted lipid-binding transport protein (Tim44 family)